MRAEQQQTPEVFENTKPPLLTGNTSSTNSSLLDTSATSSGSVALGTSSSVASETADPAAPPNVAISLNSTSPMQETPKKSPMGEERETEVKYTGENMLLEFEGDVLSVYSQSSGTVSYDSFAPLQQNYLDKMKGDAKQVSVTISLANFRFISNCYNSYNNYNSTHMF